MILAFCNEKGGVSKTTLAVHTAMWMAEDLGRRVAVVDLDTQGGVANFFNVQKEDDLAELMVSVMRLRPDRRPKIASFLHECPGHSKIALLRGSTGTRDVEADLKTLQCKPGEVLSTALAPLVSAGVVVVIDTGPHAGLLQEAAMDIADHVFVPAKPEGATEAAILSVAHHLRGLDRGMTGLIPTLYDLRSKKHFDTIADWRGTNGLGSLVYFDPQFALVGLPSRVVWGELFRTGNSIWEVKPEEVDTPPQALQTAQYEMEVIMRRMMYDIGFSRTRHGI
jgi:cellulose biosynthesis protein BcsQ